VLGEEELALLSRRFERLHESRSTQGGAQGRATSVASVATALVLLPSASSEARRRLRRRTMLFWDVHCLERRGTEIGKDSRAKRLGGELGAPTVSFYKPRKTDRGLESWLWIVVHIPRKIGRWKGFLGQPASWSLGVLGRVAFS
jgi:hypothetical protein